MKHILLEIFVDESRPDLYEMYKTHIEKHNEEIENNPYPNTGFDLFIPNNVEFTVPFQTQMVDLLIKTQMWEFTYSPNEFISSNNEIVRELKLDPSNYFSTGYYLYPRSSLAKTQLMMANHVGIIDSGYRNNLLCAFRYLPIDNNHPTYNIEAGTRLVQICHPSGPVFVNLITNKDKLTVTTRTGGFGSTGGTV
jgi:dUTPase